MYRWFPPIPCGVAVLFLASAGASAADVDFARDLRPALESKCLGCHNPNNAKGGLSLATLADIRAAGDDFLVPGNHRDSLIHEVTVPGKSGAKPEMPEKGEPLTADEARILAAWIDAGALWPDGLVLREASKADKSWWAYQPLGKMPGAGPETEGEGGLAPHPVDGFIDAKLAEQGLKRSPAASPRVLIRRATYDLTGLPPTQAEVQAFEDACRTDPGAAWPELIDRLLASPHYGERWGRHWLDVVRFGESIGYERNVIIDHLWPFRDYVIGSINADKPFDRFIREHLAGDVFGKDDPSVEVGSAFLVAGPYDDVGNQDVDQAAQIRANTLDEIINATGEAFLGMTLGCARCHDHKFDPITSEDYYALYSTFAGVRHGSRVVATAEEKLARAARVKPLESRKAEMEEERKRIGETVLARARARSADWESRWTRPAVDRTGTEERFAPLTAQFVRLVCEAQDQRPEQATGFGIDEFEVWSTGPGARNVALASEGSTASGAARRIEDFPDAYGPQHAIDGKTGARFLSVGPDLTIQLARPVEIDRVVFSSARGEETPKHGKFVFVADYRIEVSGDGETWREVAHGRDRQPVGPAHREHRWRQGEANLEEKERLATLVKEIAAIDREILALPEMPVVWVGNRNAADSRGPFHIFLGGSPRKKGSEVVPASLSALEDALPGYRLATDSDEATRRLQLAEWIGHPENPLTARVLANRLWHYHFGTGIVDTPNDFGYMGGRPTHPELLDFLAAELIDHGWRLKAMHRLIMTSETYRQASDWDEDAGSRDGDSRFLWRFPPRRLSAEEIRDTILAVSGKLDRTRGGPGFRLYHFMQDNVCTYEPLDEHGPETYRRAVYHQNARASVVDLMTEFDQADCAYSVPKRAGTTTPLQALTLLNHRFTLDMAEAFAARIGSEESVDDQVRLAFRIAFQREPDAEEVLQAAALAREHGMRALGRTLLNASELIYLD